LWLGGLSLALFITTAAVGNFFLQPERAVSVRSAGFDFLAFYTGGTFVRTGHAGQLYDLDAVRAFQQEVAKQNGLELRPEAVGPFWNPPVVAWMFAPLSMLSYRAAFLWWTVLNLTCLAGAMSVLCTMVGDGWRTWGLVPLLTLVSMPLIMSIGHGQNACLSLLILSSAVALWRGERFFAAGAVAGLLFYKPQVGAVVAAVMIVCGGWRALAGVATTGMILLLATLATLPGALTAFIQKMPGNLAFMQIQQPYAWERHVTLKAFWRLLVQGHATGEMSGVAMTLYAATSLLLAACVVTCVWKLRQRTDAVARDEILSLTILSMPLLMPFYFDYDLLLLAVPAVLTARGFLVREENDRGVTIAGIALYAWLVINPHVAAITRVNGTVVVLGALVTITMAQALRRRRGSESESEKPGSTSNEAELLAVDRDPHRGGGLDRDHSPRDGRRPGSHDRTRAAVLAAEGG
jgi:hypothetical protein